MGFVQTAFIGALAAVAIPVIVHLMFRMRTRRVDLGTVRFLREVLKKNAARKKVKRFLLLSLRITCITLLAALFARPYFVEQQRGSADRTLVVLIDRSASMELRSEGERLIDQAVQQAKQIVAKQGEQARIEWAFFDHEIYPLSDSTADDLSRDGIAAIRAPEISFGGTDFGVALRWARDICIKAAGGEKQLHVFTDFQRSGLDWSDMDVMPSDVQVQLHDLGRDAVNNVAVTTAFATRTMIRPGDATVITATVSNESPFPLNEVSLRLFLRSDRTTFEKERKISVAVGALEEFDFEIDGLQPGLWQGQVEVEVEDELRFDNRKFVALMSAPAWRVLVVNGQPYASAMLSETFFLESALRLAPPGETYAGSPYSPDVVTAEGLEQADFNEYKAVVLANVPDVSDAAAKRLETFVESGGGLIVFSGDQVTPQSYHALDAVGLSPGQFDAIQETHDLPWRVQEWDSKSSIFEPFNDPQYGDLHRIAFHAYTRVVPSEDAKVLASFRRGDPLLLEVAKGDGRTLWLTSSCDRSWSDWPRGRLYLPMVHQMLGHLTGLNEGGPVRSVTMDATNAVASETKPGVYDRGHHWDVINPSARESEMDRCSLAEFSEQFALNVSDGNDSEADDGDDAQVASLAPSTIQLRDNEFWHWIALALIGFLCVECFLSNRTTA
tara:strand:- start:2517 stop:4523 length:2007 start_codon:yes stop_codon:yes gene_type:complete